ncbi:MAG: AI-2E family transporter [Acetobacteraceae bacterium]|nr:AI-2E family transporter [Acetobacteraceae bacterium]
MDQALIGLERWALALAAGVVRGVPGLLSGFVALILGPVVAFYILRDLPRIRERFCALLPPRVRGEVLSLVGDVDQALGGFVRGQLLVASAVGVLAALGLSLLRVRFALVLGLLAGVTDLIPYFGPAVGALVASGVALLQSLPLALEVGALFFAIQQFESAVLSPHVVGSRVGLHPVVVIFALLVGGHFLGFWGLLLAVPVAAVARVLVYHLLRRLGGQP